MIKSYESLFLKNYYRDIALLIYEYIERNKTEPHLIALGGGSSPEKYHKEFVDLILRKKRNNTFFDNTFFIVSDERHVKMGNTLSNTSMILQTLIKPLVLESHFIYPIFKNSLNRMVSVYQKDIDQLLFKSSLAILGVGSDGHSASLFPDDRSLKDSSDSVIPVRRSLGPDRLSLSMNFINQINERWYIVNTTEKKEVILNIGDRAYPLSYMIQVEDKVLMPYDL